jgi:hypothetical protein
MNTNRTGLIYFVAIAALLFTLVSALPLEDTKQENTDINGIGSRIKIGVPIFHN